MERIRFNCSECDTKLGVGADLAGKTITCPQCHKKTVVVTPNEHVKAPVPEAGDPPIKFPCTKCGTRLKVAAKLSGRAIACPSCGENTMVPDPDEGGSYGFSEAPQEDADDEPIQETPLDEWWPDGEALDLPSSWRMNLSRARNLAEDKRWAKALDLLNDLFQKGLRGKGKPGTHYLCKPLAYCLGRWAARELDRLDDEGTKPSKPVRLVLKKAADMKRWGGTLSNTDCPICSRKLRNLIGTTQIRTMAGSAYLCCARPTPGDDALICKLDRINTKLVLATSLDPDNRQVPKALKLLPDWFRAVDMYESGWTRAVVDDDEGRNAPRGRGSLAGAIAGDAAGNLVGNLLCSLLG